MILKKGNFIDLSKYSSLTRRCILNTLGAEYKKDCIYLLVYRGTRTGHVYEIEDFLELQSQMSRKSLILNGYVETYLPDVINLGQIE